MAIAWTDEEKSALSTALETVTNGDAKNFIAKCRALNLTRSLSAIYNRIANKKTRPDTWKKKVHQPLQHTLYAFARGGKKLRGMSKALIPAPTGESAVLEEIEPDKFRAWIEHIIEGQQRGLYSVNNAYEQIVHIVKTR